MEILDINEARSLVGKTDYQNRKDQAINHQNKMIKESAERGNKKTCFTVSCEFEGELKKEYQNKGYHFEPTGYIGGIWQRTENICW